LETSIARTFAALSATNEAILYEKSPEELYGQVCEAAFSSGDFLATAIFLLEPETGMLRLTAGFGEDVARQRRIDISIVANTPAGFGVGGQAFRDQKLVVSNDFLNDPRSLAWRVGASEAHGCPASSARGRQRPRKIHPAVKAEKRRRVASRVNEPQLVGARTCRLARKIVGPWQRRLTGERIEQHLRAIGERRVHGQFQTCAPVGRHRLPHADDLECRCPPPARGLRSLWLGHRAPPREFAHDTFEWYCFSRMHRILLDPDDTLFRRDPLREARLLPAVLPVRGDVRPRFIEVHVLIDVIDPRHRNKVMMLAVGCALFGELDFVGALEMVDFSDRLSIRRNDVHMLLDQRGISHVSSPMHGLSTENAPSPNKLRGLSLLLPPRSTSPGLRP
jgi:hypothetical protein